MPDPGMQIASFVGMKAFDAIATGVYNHSPCSTPGWRPPNAAAALFATMIRGAAGADEKEWKKDVTVKLEQIGGKLDVISDQLGIIARGVDQLLTAVQLIDLKLDNIIQGQSAYATIGNIKANYRLYYEDIQSIKDPDMSPQAYQDRLRNRFVDLIGTEQIHKQIERIVLALTEGVTSDVPGLLRNFLKRCKIEHDKGPHWVPRALGLYEAYEAYMSDVLFVLNRAYLMYEHAVAFFELQGGQPNVTVPKTADLAKTKKRQLNEVLNTYNSELERFVLQVCRPYLQAEMPAFLDNFFVQPKEIFRRAYRFTSLMLNERYGIRGRLITMGTAPPSPGMV